MPIIAISGDVPSQEIARVISDGLGPRYRVQQQKSVGWGFGKPADADEDNIAVTAGSGRFRRTQVRVNRDGDRTVIHIAPPGPLQLWLINTIGIARKVRQALQDAPELKAA
jgi:hypothetical protein